MDEQDKLEDEAYLAEMSDAEVPEVEAKPTEEVKPTEEPDERKEVIAGFTEEEVKANFERLDSLQKALDTTNGTFGNRFAEQQERIAAQQAIIDELQSRQGGLNPEALTRLEEEFPELAEILSPEDDTDTGEGLEAGEELAEEAAQPEPDKIDQFIEEQRERDQARELRNLSKRHKDWQHIAMYSRDDNGLVSWNDPGFGVFVGNLPEDERNTLLNVWDAEFVGDKIEEYKATLRPVENNTPSLEDAVRPQGLPGQHAPSDLDEEEAAFRKEMAQI